jgi:CRISPR system Cascade subunit CasB
MTDQVNGRAGQTVLRWWSRLQPAPNGQGGDRAALARLRRCATALEAASEEATLDLAHQLRLGWPQLDRVAIAAAVLAHVRTHAAGAPVARQLAPPNGRMSWLRLRRLLQADTDDAQITAFRRAAALADGSLNVADLGESLLDWSDARRRRWIYDFHQSSAPAEDAEEPAA